MTPGQPRHRSPPSIVRAVWRRVYCTVRSFPQFCALLFAALLLLLAALHVYWAMGGNWGRSVTVPTVAGRRVINPTPFATYVVAFLLLTGAIIICGQAHLFPTGHLSPLFRIASWCVCGVFLLRTLGDFKTFGIFKTVHATAFAFWDTRLYSPLCFILAVLAAVVSTSCD